jgi:hypothetical protein
MDKDIQEQVRAEVVQAVMDAVGPAELDRHCLHWAGYTVEALSRRGVRAVLQAGGCSWPFRSPKWIDDGVSSTHFSYLWNPREAMTRWAQGLHPELHVWAATPDGKGGGMLIDFTTKFQPAQCQRILGLPWEAPKPPEYLWCGLDGVPDGVHYRPDLEAIRFALAVWTNHLERRCAVEELDDFTKGYIECALWSSNDDSTPQGGEPLDKNYGLEDIAPKSLKRVKIDCAMFQKDNAELLELYYHRINAREDTPQSYAGHDYWLTRNGHGAGFFDRGLGKLGDDLHQAAKACGSCDLYIGDDKRVHMM